jgi:hypothetical protein
VWLGFAVSRARALTRHLGSAQMSILERQSQRELQPARDRCARVAWSERTGSQGRYGEALAPKPGAAPLVKK